MNPISVDVADAVTHGTTSMVDVLTPIWQRVLQRSPIDREDNFFDVGGTPALAMSLVAEIAAVCGRDFPLETIPQAPTIATMAAVMEGPVLPPLSPVVLLRTGSEEPPIFIVHGLDGGLVKLMPMVRLIATRRPIYGIRAPGFWGEKCVDRIEDMASFYVDAIRRVQSHGPYSLIGYSFGGLVTHEMARQLDAVQEKVRLLAMLDTYPHLRHLRLGQRIRLVFRRANRHLSQVSPSHPWKSLAYIARRWKNRSRVSRAAAERSALPASPLSWHDASQRVRGRAEVALGNFRPQSYSGKIQFLQGGTDTYFPKDPAAVWGDLSGGIVCQVVPGDHLTMLSDHFETVAAVLSGILKN
jgi:acetoacetyl-CoA synthetase